MPQRIPGSSVLSVPLLITFALNATFCRQSAASFAILYWLFYGLPLPISATAPAYGPQAARREPHSPDPLPGNADARTHRH